MSKSKSNTKQRFFLGGYLMLIRDKQMEGIHQKIHQTIMVSQRFTEYILYSHINGLGTLKISIITGKKNKPLSVIQIWSHLN